MGPVTGRAASRGASPQSDKPVAPSAAARSNPTYAATVTADGRAIVAPTPGTSLGMASEPQRIQSASTPMAIPLAPWSRIGAAGSAGQTRPSAMEALESSPLGEGENPDFSW